eukprot:tig00000042_g15650.t1
MGLDDMFDLIKDSSASGFNRASLPKAPKKSKSQKEKKCNKIKCKAFKGAKQFNKNAKKLAKSVKKLTKNVKKFSKGAKKLTRSVKKLVKSNKKLTKALKKAVKTTFKFNKGLKKLGKVTKKISVGAKKIANSAEKISGIFDKNVPELKELFDKLTAALERATDKFEEKAAHLDDHNNIVADDSHFLAYAAGAGEEPSFADDSADADANDNAATFHDDAAFTADGHSWAAEHSISVL